jgi:hypothetical protein
MNLALFGGFDRRPIGPGWTKETFVAVFGGGEVDLTESPPEGEGQLTAFALFGGMTLIVPAGTRISMGGASIFGGRSVNVQEGDGPAIRLKAVAIFGGVEAREPKPGAR